MWRTLLRELGEWRFQPRLRVAGAMVRLLPINSFAGVRTALYRAGGIQIEPRVSILGPIRLFGPGHFAGRLTLCQGCVIAPGVTFQLDADVVVGAEASLGPGVTLMTATHALGFGSKRMSSAVSSRPIRIEPGAWVGVGSLIMPGVTVGAGCVVSAGSVVANDAPPNVLVAGNPAVVVQQLPFGDR